MGNRSSCQTPGAFGSRKFAVVLEWPRKVEVPEHIQPQERDRFIALTNEKVEELVWVVRPNRGQGKRRRLIRRMATRIQFKPQPDLDISKALKPSLLSRVRRIFQRKGA